MENSHRANVLVTSCLKTPVDPQTKAPLALYERERALPYATGHAPDNRNNEKEVDSDSDSDRSDGAGQGDGGSPLLIRDCRLSGEHINLCQLRSSNEEYYRKLEELKRAHLRAMAELEGMYRNKLGITAAWPLDCHAEETRRMKLEKSSTMPMCNLRNAFSAVELNHVGDCGMSNTSEEGVADYDLAMKSLLTSPKERIRNMWQNFTVGELTPRDRPTSCSSLMSQPEGRRGQAKGRGGLGKECDPEQDTWRHRVTIPKPFQMTLREAEKKRSKVKSRSEVELENALLRKQLAELSECQRKFRASPVPAHVYLPLYQEITARHEERRLLSRQRCSGASQKPFRFLERERRKKEEREAQLRDQPAKEDRKAFRAKPVPRSVYDSTVSERMKEDQLYRAIKMQMRSQELLHSASLPRSMLGNRASTKRREPAEERTEADFRPRINEEVPDFDVSYHRFQKQLLSRRDTRPTTVCEPFQLRTALTASRRRVLADSEAETASRGGGRWPYSAPSRPRSSSSSLCSSLSGSLELLPAKTTDATKKRQEAVRRVLEEKKRAEEEEESWRQRQKRKERRLQRVISKRAQANDPHTALSQTSTAKLRQFRKQDLQRRKEYREEMREIRERVKGRPLLLEQVTQRNAKQAAEKRYTDTLQGLGLSEELVRSLAPQHSAPSEESSVYSEEKWGKGDPIAGLSVAADPVVDDYPDDYEELDEQEKGQDEDYHDCNKDAEEEEQEEDADEDSRADRES